MSTLVSDPFDVATDPAMPFLRSALDPRAAQSELSRACVRWKDAGQMQVTAIRVARYKPGRRCLIEYDVTLGPSAEFTILGKARAKGVNYAVFNLMQKLRQSGFDDHSPDGVSVPEPIGVAPAFSMWLQRKIGGQSIAKLMSGPDGLPLARRVAEAIHKLHRAKLPTDREHSIADEWTILDNLLADLAHRFENLAGRLARLCRDCFRLTQLIRQTEPTGIHRDFYPDQVHVVGERLYLLDFDLFASGDPALDVGNFLGHLTEQSLRNFDNPHALADREGALEERFAALAGEETRSAVGAYALLTLARHVALSVRFPERQPFTERLLEICEKRIASFTMPNAERRPMLVSA
jgi:Phosphotransferase enzyme family